LLGALVIKLIDNGIYVVKDVPLGLRPCTSPKSTARSIIGIAIMLAVAVDR